MVGEARASQAKVLVVLAGLKEAGCVLSTRRALSATRCCGSSGAHLCMTWREAKHCLVGSEWCMRAAVPVVLEV
jgi:hypothetical protein